MTIQHQVKGSEGKFFVSEDDRIIAHLQYNLRDDKMQVFHTEVDEAYRNKQMGEKLVKAGVQYAREKNFTLLPLCEFAKAVIEKNPGMQDVL